jgi:hypothetical protein
MIDDIIVVEGKKDAQAVRRRELGRQLQLGDADAKQFVHRLNALRVSREEFLENLEAWETAQKTRQAACEAVSVCEEISACKIEATGEAP